MIRRPPRSTLDRSSAASDVYKRQPHDLYLQLNLNNLGLTLLVLVLLAAGTLPFGNTVIFKFQKPFQLIFHPKIVQNLFSMTLKNSFLIRKCSNLTGSSSSSHF